MIRAIGLLGLLTLALNACSSANCTYGSSLGSWRARNGGITLDLKGGGSYAITIITKEGVRSASGSWSLDKSAGDCMISLSDFPFTLSDMQGSVAMTASAPSTPRAASTAAHFQIFKMEKSASGAEVLIVGIGPEAISLQRASRTN